MFLIALTGGIATGKSTAANVFKEHNIPVVDSDVIARQIVEPGEKAWKEIRDAFGPGVFHENGELNRDALGKVIFSETKKRVILNRITHPKIQRKMFWSILQHFYEGHKFIVLDIPLFFETEAMLPYVYKIITVSCDNETQTERLMARNGYSKSDAELRIKAQFDLTKKCERSHFVIDNSGSFEETRAEVVKVLNYIQSSNHHLTNRLYLFIFAGFLFLVVCFILMQALS